MLASRTSAAARAAHGHRSHIQGITKVSEAKALPDATWAAWEPLIEEVRPHGKTPTKDLRRTIAAILWRHQNGAKLGFSIVKSLKRYSMPDSRSRWRDATTATPLRQP